MLITLIISPNEKYIHDGPKKKSIGSIEILMMRAVQNPGNIPIRSSVQSVKNNASIGPMIVSPVSFIMTNPSTLFEEKAFITKAINGPWKDDNKVIKKISMSGNISSNPVAITRMMVAMTENI